MKTRQAKKIVRRQAIRCRRRIDGPEDVTTAGTRIYPEGTYQKALRKVLRKMDRELTERRPGAIERLAGLNRERNALRVAELVRKARSGPQGRRAPEQREGSRS